MTRPTDEQIADGNAIAALLHNTRCAKALGYTYLSPPKYQHLISAYLSGEIDSVTAIYMAMNGEI